MKTLAEFLQRLQDDAAFEKQAHAFDHGDDLMAFVKREGYDFTLEQLMNALEPQETLPAETGGLAPAPADIDPSPPPGPDEAEFPRHPEAFSCGERSSGLPKMGIDDFTGEPPVERVPKPMGAIPPPEPEKVPLAELFKSGGGRHRGFSAQRLKSLSEEEP
jgi:predicted ribosomally synthesized peptide with nif11-like leader